MILGMDWLSSLGKIEADFKKLQLKWRKKGRLCELQGDPSLSKASASWKSTLKMLSKEEEGYYITPVQ